MRALTRWPVLALAAALLGGCAYAPGLSIGKGLEGTSQSANSGEDPPPGALLSITPELIRQQRANQPTDVGQDVKSLFAVAKPYTIGTGDLLNIVIWDHPEILPQAADVSAEGLIQFPYIGTIKLLGLTEHEARAVLSTRLAQYFKNPQITLRVQTYRSSRVYMDGEVRTPGLQAVNDIPMTLPEAIGRAGGFTPAADRSAIALTRDGKTTLIDLQLLTARGINPSNILLGNGDLVRVPGREESKVFVLGEVPRTGSQLLRNGRLTLNEALGEAGGINPISGDPRQIYVVRSAAAGKALIYHLDARTAVAYALAEGFELKARDVVFVDPVPLVNWNRVISLILPSAQAVTVTRDAVKLAP